MSTIGDYSCISRQIATELRDKIDFRFIFFYFYFIFKLTGNWFFEYKSINNKQTVVIPFNFFYYLFCYVFC